MADSAEIVGPTSPTSGAAGPGGSARIRRLIEPASGQNTIGGEDVTGINPVALRRTIGYAIQAMEVD
ncbi:hypothetical protein AB0G60_03690 [Streptomyces angustmyceticus]|uniref:Uncharacterized protein n=1 Tax=Streptomyces angustmyceticus TaxID=285578 RepID=A0A5J4L4J0_9ACTN|nr:hypothetical protein [Streptomyces angustmyceticus]UAL71852.1 hypothetical protein K7396_03655 [Streptomyces angustmyceticus]GES27704.1 hypothetical protein San01_01910 [Streptomyces angustmyceticus]